MSPDLKASYRPVVLLCTSHVHDEHTADGISSRYVEEPTVEMVAVFAPVAPCASGWINSAVLKVTNAKTYCSPVRHANRAASCDRFTI